jgi:hypothetical protein
MWLFRHCRGYVNSLGTTNDGFSLLRGEVVLESLQRMKGGDRGKRAGASGKKKQFDEEEETKPRRAGKRGPARKGKMKGNRED